MLITSLGHVLIGKIDAFGESIVGLVTSTGEVGIGAEPYSPIMPQMVATSQSSGTIGLSTKKTSTVLGTFSVDSLGHVGGSLVTSFGELIFGGLTDTGEPVLRTDTQVTTDSSVSMTATSTSTGEANLTHTDSQLSLISNSISSGSVILNLEQLIAYLIADSTSSGSCILEQDKNIFLVATSGSDGTLTLTHVDSQLDLVSTSTSSGSCILSYLQFLYLISESLSSGSVTINSSLVSLPQMTATSLSSAKLILCKEFKPVTIILDSDNYINAILDGI